MKIVIAPDSFKESLSAAEAVDCIRAGFLAVFPDAEIVGVPVADGGEGTVDALVAATGGRLIRRTVTGPLGAPVEAFFGVTGDGRTGVIEMAAAAGLMLIPPADRDPLAATSRGVGELILAALDEGVEHLIVGLGGSATNDGGAGLIQALGGRLTDADGADLGAGGGALDRLAHVDVSGIDPRIGGCRIDVACDVDNPLVGPEGASAVFGPQKGATPEMVAQLDRNLRRLAEVLRRDLAIDVADHAGGGAAGGLGAALFGVFGGRLRPGVEIVTEAVGLDALVRDADLVVTGEGRMDGQSVRGKTPMGVARVARANGKPVIGVAGCLGEGADRLHAHGVEAIFSVLTRACTVEEALAEARDNLRDCARNIAATLKLGLGLSGSAVGAVSPPDRENAAA
ncbi:glycerate kinase [Brevundimonas sp.]|jgi:glycerate kinase|uniref:glycerate kinase n=1 Tax=Brevundimonas sp. TaxID=1871086 RepID=UPI0037BF1F1F